MSKEQEMFLKDFSRLTPGRFFLNWQEGAVRNHPFPNFTEKSLTNP